MPKGRSKSLANLKNKAKTADASRSKTWEKKMPYAKIYSKNAEKKDLLKNVGKFEADLNLFLSKIHENPSHFKEEMTEKITEFNDAFEKFKEKTQVKDETFTKISVFLANTIEYYRKDLTFLVPTICDTLSSYGNIMHPFVRMKCVQTITIVAKKGLWDPIESITFLIRLFIIKDKELRTFLSKHVVSAIKKLLEKNKDNKVKTKLTVMFNELLTDANEKVSKATFILLTEIYKKAIWRDKKQGNIISECAFNDYSKVTMMSCMYMMENTVEFAANFESSEEEDDMENAHNEKEKKKHRKISKKKEKRLEDDVKKATRRQKRRDKVTYSINSFQIDDIYNPQEFCDKLFVRLQKSKDKFNFKLGMMHCIARLIGRHKLIQPNFYGYLQRYMKPGQKECPKIQMYLAEACHQQVPADSVLPVMKYIIMNFANEACKEDRIVSGLNCIREMCQRMPLLMEEDDLNFLATLRYFKSKSVSSSAKALINLYRDLNPYLLRKEFRGKNFTDAKEEERLYLGKSNFQYGDGGEVVNRIDGVEQLKEENGGVDIECDRMLTERDFKKIRALKRRRMTEKAMREDEVQDGDEPAIHIPRLNILEYAEKKKLYKRFLEDPNNMGTKDLQKIQDMDQEELMNIISDNEESYASLEGEEGDDEESDEEEVDVDELDSDEFEELDADEEGGEFDSEDDEEEGDSDDEECPELIEMDGEEEEDSDIEETDEANLGKRSGPGKTPKSILKKAKPEKKLKTGEDGPESTVNEENSGTEEEDEFDDESSDLELSSDDGFNKERRNLGFMAEEDIYTHKLTRAEQRRQEKEGFDEIAKVKKWKYLIEERGRKTNTTKELNKPFMMTVAKKVRKVDSYKQLRVRNKQMKVQQGHIHKGMKGNLKSKMRKLRS